VIKINLNTLYFKAYILALCLQTLKNDYKKNQWAPFSLTQTQTQQATERNCCKKRENRLNHKFSIDNT